MRLDHETIESFVSTRDAANEQAANDGQVTGVKNQIVRAAHIARNGGNYWTNIAYDAEKDILTQACLRGVYQKHGWFSRGKIVNVQLYLRASGLDTNFQSYDYDYAALFNLPRNVIKIPSESYDEGEGFPEKGKTVLPDTEEWRQMDYTLGQIAVSNGIERLQHPFI